MLSLIKVIFREVDNKADIRRHIGEKKMTKLYFPKYQTVVVKSPFLQWILGVANQTYSLLICIFYFLIVIFSAVMKYSHF